MSDKILTEFVFWIKIYRETYNPESIAVLALDDVCARSMAIDISNLQLSWLWKCSADEAEVRAPVVLCDIWRVKVPETDRYIQVKSLV